MICRLLLVMMIILLLPYIYGPCTRLLQWFTAHYIITIGCWLIYSDLPVVYFGTLGHSYSTFTLPTYSYYLHPVTDYTLPPHSCWAGDLHSVHCCWFDCWLGDLHVGGVCYIVVVTFIRLWCWFDWWHWYGPIVTRLGVGDVDCRYTPSHSHTLLLRYPHRYHHVVPLPYGSTRPTTSTLPLHLFCRTACTHTVIHLHTHYLHYLHTFTLHIGLYIFWIYYIGVPLQFTHPHIDFVVTVDYIVSLLLLWWYPLRTRHTVIAGDYVDIQNTDTIHCWTSHPHIIVH